MPAPWLNRTFHVTDPRNFTPVLLLTAPARRWKLSDLARSLTLRLYVPAVIRFTRAPEAVLSEIVRAGPTCATSFFTGGGVVTVPTVNEPRIASA